MQKLLFNFHKQALVLVLLLLFSHRSHCQAPGTNAPSTKISEKLIEFKTYPYSEPNPVPQVDRIYPYFYFNGYTNTAELQKWKMVILENEFIQVFVCPDIGGKIWGAIEKSTGKEFLYYNHVVKFRDIAMRGPWTSGGLEYNFGDIGHSPTCATPVDYKTEKNADGSVSCTLGAIDLPSGTKWNVEIKVSPGKAFFETRVKWFNNTQLPCSYYHWMNAAAKAGDDLELIYPGKNWIGHGETSGMWPNDNNRDVNWYKNNNFGRSKSYHVLNSYSNYFGGYWHEKDFGFGHYSYFDEKPGKKLWIWGLAPQGMIWEDLLTDTDGQYIEFQAGKLFNQAAGSSTKTPFKHKEFAPHDADIMNEIWFPLKGTGGMSAVSEFAVLNTIQNKNNQTLLLSALQDIDDQIMVYKNGEVLLSEKLKLEPLELYETNIDAEASDEIKVILGNKKLVYSSNEKEILVDRPVKLNKDVTWESAYGLFTKGMELEKQRDFAGAKEAYEKTLEKDPGFLPALNRLALSFYRQMKYEEAFELILKALAINTYDGEANYLLGLICRETGDYTLSKSGFSISMGDVTYRSPAATELADLFLLEKDWNKAKKYALKALAYNQYNLNALETIAIAERKLGNSDKAMNKLTDIAKLDGTSHFQQFEAYLISGTDTDKTLFLEGITNELPHESFLDLAISYFKKGCTEETIKVLELAPENPIVDLWLAYLDGPEKDAHLKSALDKSAEFVFPHRTKTANVLQSFLAERPHWKLHYYLGLILWNKNLISNAKEHFMACGNEPDFAAFYLAKSKLVNAKDEKLVCLQTANRMFPNDWRTGVALAEFYLEDNHAEKAHDLIKPFVTKYPEQSIIGLCYAQTMMALRYYEDAVSFLENYTLLPFEGATIGHDLYNEACIRSSFSALKNENYQKAIRFAEKAKQWPSNLGVGRPYDVDERLEDYILMKAYRLSGDKKNSRKYASKVIKYESPGHLEENPNLYLQLKLLVEHGYNDKADSFLSTFLAKSPENNKIKWVAAKLKDSPEVNIIENQIMRDPETTRAPNVTSDDRKFGLLLDFLHNFEK